MKVKPVYHGDGVYIRITHDRKSKYKKLFSLDKEFWKDDQVITKHNNATRLNKIISDNLQNRGQ